MAKPELPESADKLATEIAARIRALPSLKTEPVRAVRREFSKRLATSPPRFVIDLGLSLLKKPGVHRFVAYELVKHHRAAAAALRAKDLERLGAGLDEWGEVDCFACYIAGPATVTDPFGNVLGVIENPHFSIESAK